MLISFINIQSVQIERYFKKRIGFNFRRTENKDGGCMYHVTKLYISRHV